MQNERIQQVIALSGELATEVEKSGLVSIGIIQQIDDTNRQIVALAAIKKELKEALSQNTAALSATTQRIDDALAALYAPTFKEVAHETVAPEAETESGKEVEAAAVLAGAAEPVKERHECHLCEDIFYHKVDLVKHLRINHKEGLQEAVDAAGIKRDDLPLDELARKVESMEDGQLYERGLVRDNAEANGALCFAEGKDREVPDTFRGIRLDDEAKALWCKGWDAACDEKTERNLATLHDPSADPCAKCHISTGCSECCESCPRKCNGAQTCREYAATDHGFDANSRKDQLIAEKADRDSKCDKWQGCEHAIACFDPQKAALQGTYCLPKDQDGQDGPSYCHNDDCHAWNDGEANGCETHEHVWECEDVKGEPGEVASSVEPAPNQHQAIIRAAIAAGDDINEYGAFLNPERIDIPMPPKCGHSAYINLATASDGSFYMSANHTYPNGGSGGPPFVNSPNYRYRLQAILTGVAEIREKWLKTEKSTKRTKAIAALGEFVKSTQAQPAPTASTASQVITAKINEHGVFLNPESIVIDGGNSHKLTIHIGESGGRWYFGRTVFDGVGVGAASKSAAVNGPGYSDRTTAILAAIDTVMSKEWRMAEIVGRKAAREVLDDFVAKIVNSIPVVKEEKVVADLPQKEEPKPYVPDDCDDCGNRGILEGTDDYCNCPHGVRARKADQSELERRKERKAALAIDKDRACCMPPDRDWVEVDGTRILFCRVCNLIHRMTRNGGVDVPFEIGARFNPLQGKEESQSLSLRDRMKTAQTSVSGGGQPV